MDTKSKHPFGKSLDTEQTFVVRWPHDEHSFDTESPGPQIGQAPGCRGGCGPGSAGGQVVAALAFPSIRSQQGLRTSRSVPTLGVVRGGRWEPLADDGQELVDFDVPRLVVVPDHRTRRPSVPAIRRRARRLTGRSAPSWSLGHHSPPRGGSRSPAGRVRWTLPPDRTRPGGDRPRRGLYRAAGGHVVVHCRAGEPDS